MTTTVLNFQRATSRDVENTNFGEKALLCLLKEAGGAGSADRSLAKLIAQILVATTSHAVRDAAALALVDLGARGETEALITVIASPESVGHNGTPLFALDELGGSLPLGLLVGLIEQGSYEAIAEALILLRDGRVTLPNDHEELVSYQEQLEALAGLDNPTIADAASIAATHLSSR